MNKSKYEKNEPLLSGKVLVAEDQPEVRQLLVILLETAGMNVVAVDNGEDLVRLGTTSSWDIILTDIQMPRMDGIEATKKLRSQYVNQPIIALTGNAVQTCSGQYEDVGFTGFIGKPFTRKSFLETLSAHLMAAHDERENIEKDIASEVDALSRGFISTLPQQHVKAVQYLAQKQWRELAGLAHAIAGSASTFGLTELGKAAQMLELSLMRVQHPSYEGDCSEQIEKANAFSCHIQQVLTFHSTSEVFE
ncbi:Hpt domain-containing response regulator [Alteromonas sp. a30]|uniref:Hpt domain-containing response regulator n=1 Tax=Alteromonas sp. a30 TaxID=2730917 RepID=UPI00227F6150|nr:response regulator [Alteromonas sp. a30]MCY7295638.1 response regulator [Alteromonas sp. a30]